jgi:diguanylate cyclase (GGDEF)-like protein
MYKNNRKTIGVFVAQIHQEYQRVLASGINKRAQELGYNVAYFSNFLGYGEFQYESGEKSIALLPWYGDLDGIITLPDTMFAHGFDEQIKEYVRRYAGCPVVSIRQRSEEFYNVLVEDSTILDDILKHFIIDHGYKKINFLTGPKDNPVSLERLDSYRRIMKEHHLEVKEEQIFYGDFWKFLGYDTVDFWLSEPELIPEAIICANDYMAITVCNALAEKGFAVPRDIAVSGCDNIAITEDFSPTITTAGIPVYDMGIEAVDKIDRCNRGLKEKQNSFLPTVTNIRESCGCTVSKPSEERTLRRNDVIMDLEAADKAIYNNAFMSVELTGVKTVDELDRKLASYTYMNEGFSSFYMCLQQNWEEIGQEEQSEFANREDMILEVGIRNGVWLQKTEFSRRELIPAIYTEDKPQIFYFNMLHYQEICYGYTAISFYNNQTYQASYQGWLINICNALENIRIHNMLNRLVCRLEDMYIKDELTGLYNRRALSQLAQKYLDQCVKNQDTLMVFSADMDKLKFINDNFGHSYGDVAIKAVADALLHAAKDDEICIRVSGDEFVVVGMEYDQMKMEEFITNFEDYLKQYNDSSNLQFKVHVSYGWSIVKPSAGVKLEEYLVISDSKMYQQKYQKEALLLRHRGEHMEPEE